jgi:fructokinase
MNHLCSNLLYTSSSNGVFLRTLLNKLTFPVRKIIPVSTIGAGDNFNAGILYGLYSEKIGRNQLNHLSDDHWKVLLNFAVEFASEVCMSYDNYISEPFATKYTISGV